MHANILALTTPVNLRYFLGMHNLELFLTSLGKNIQSARLELGYTQLDAEELTGIPCRRYQDIEAGKANVTMKTLFAIATAFKVTIAALCDITK